MKEQQTENKFTGVLISKSTDAEKRLATFLVLEPQDEDFMTSDLHADWYSESMVENSCHNFNRFCRKANLLHLMPTTSFEFIESYIQKAAMTVNDRLIKKGSWLATIYVNTTELGDSIWEGIKSGQLNGLSIQAYGSVENLE